MTEDSPFAEEKKRTRRREIVHDEQDLKRTRREVLRDAWMFLISVMVLASVGLAINGVNEQKEGRRIGTSITCVITGAVLEGSHSFIISSSTQPLPPKLEKNLVEQGYPTKAVREANAIVTADEYSKVIEKKVEAVSPKAKGLVLASGHINCALLKKVTKAK